MSDALNKSSQNTALFFEEGGTFPPTRLFPICRDVSRHVSTYRKYAATPSAGHAPQRPMRFVLRKCLVLLICAFAGMMTVGILPVTKAWAQSSQEYLENGNRFYNAKKYEDAVSSYVKSIQLEPKTQAKAYLNCARAYSMLKDYLNAQRYYDYYFEVSGDQSDKKVNAEYKAVVRKLAKGAAYVRPDDQARVLVQLQSVMMSGPFLNRQGGGAFAYYDILMRTGFAEPMLATLQKDLSEGMMREVMVEITPVEGQPLPNLDRLGWEYERTKLQRATQFANVEVDSARMAHLNHTALGWEAYLRSEYARAAEYFDQACDSAHPLPAAYWGRMMTAFHTDSDKDILRYVDLAESVYKQAELGDYTPYFALLRAQVYRNLGDDAATLKQLDIMGAAL